MTIKELIPNVNTIHLASELIIITGITFYFTNKFNTANAEINKIKAILQHQNVKINDYEKKLKDYDSKISNLESIISDLKNTNQVCQIPKENFISNSPNNESIQKSKQSSKTSQSSKINEPNNVNTNQNIEKNKKSNSEFDKNSN